MIKTKNKGKKISKEKYIKTWESNLETFNLLLLTPSKEISQEVDDWLLEGKRLISLVAHDKGLKAGDKQ